VRLILASASPRRAELLRAAGYRFDVVVTDVDESIRDGESPSAYVRRLAAEKSAAAQALGSDLDFRETETIRMSPKRENRDLTLFLGADTTVVVGAEILAKPRDDADAAAMLKRLSGRAHEVLTGISLRRGAFEVGRVETTSVYFAPLTDEEIAWYVATGEGRDKAGAYAIQGYASRFIPRIDGSYSNVVGLPVACVRELLTTISDTRRDRSSPNRSDAD
jgi:nucleoside triphosphate pyrophosphatase